MKNFFKVNVAAAFVFALSIAALPPVYGQDETPTKVTIQNRSGDLPFSTSIGTGIERVDVSSGNLILTIPIVDVPGRGIPYNFHLRYDARNLVVATRTPATGPWYDVWNVGGDTRNLTPSYLSGGNYSGLGWWPGGSMITYGTKKINCTEYDYSNYKLFYLYRDNNGVRRPFVFQKAVPNHPDLCGSFYDSSGPAMSADGFFTTGTSVQNVANPSIYAPDGTAITSVNPFTVTIKDPNGNFSGDGPGATDTLGRVNLTTQTGTNQILYKVWDSNGVQQTYTVNFIDISVHTAFNISGSLGPYLEYQGNRSVVSSVVQPNGRSYQFQYESGTYGGITRIDLPTSAYVTYTWATLANGYKTVRYVSSRTVVVNGQSSTWNFNLSVPNSNSPEDLRMLVTDPQGNQSVYLTHYGSVTQAQLFQGTTSGTLLRQHDVLYACDGDVTQSQHDGDFQYDLNNPQACRPTRITSTLENGLVSKKEFDYDVLNYTYHPYLTPLGQGPPDMSTVETWTTSRGNVTEIREFAYGTGAPGALLRRTTKAYLHDSYSAYLANNIVGKVIRESICDGTGSTCNSATAWPAKLSETTYEYDNYAAGENPMQGPTTAPQHDSAYSPSFTLRGNVTRVTRWKNTGTPLVTTYTYDDLGNIVAIKDPLGHTTTYSYNDSWASGACPPPANTKAFVTQMTNALNQNVQMSYWPCTALRYSHKDQNDINAGRAGVTSTYDFMGRMTQQIFPDGGQTTNTYNDAPPVSVTTTKKIDNAQNLVSTSISDGLGRVIQSQVTSDPQGTVYSDTTYDSLGHTWKVSNPYRSTGEATYGLTETQFDALGRVTKLIPPDGTASTNNVTTAYAGNVTTVTDQQGKQRRSTTDALGRLIQVDEPNPTLSTPASTVYTYDVLGNLLTVLQSGSRQRTFTYNSLSQLLTAANPESGTISYSYDNDGNLYQKTDARSIVTTHTYDILHRLTYKSYSGEIPPASTPPAAFDYDFAQGWSLENPIGRLVRFRTPDHTNASLFSYDPMGRVKLQYSNRPSIYDISWDSTQATYDLAGNLTSLTYPSGRKVTQGFNSAAQLNRVTFDSFSGTAVNYNYLSSASYSPAGAPTGLTLGNGITELTSYNSRLQPVQFVVPDPVLANTSLINKLYSFNAGSANNGNVASITDQLNSGRTQSFTYDHLNRLSTAQSSATSGTDCWGLSFGYDVWANLLSSSTTKCSPPNLNYSIDPSTNRISSPGFTYDTAGNMTYDPGTQKSYQWDAESRMKTLNTTGATYTYDANGSRVRKQSGTDFTEYIYFGSQPIAERNADGSWSDYIFAGGKRVARADSYEDRIRIYGTNCSNCGWQWAHFSFPSAGGLSGYTIRAGDRIYWRQYQGGGARGGIYLQFSDGSNSAWGVTDQDGQVMNADSWGGWHSRRVDLGSNFLNKVVTDLVLSDEGYNSGGWDIYFQDIAVVSTDGTVRPIWSRQKSVSLNVSATSGMTGVGYELNHDAGGYGMDLAHNGTTYYHGDHLGSSRQMSSAQGYPVWEATYLPFGQEWNAQSTVNHYKFTGKERDTESNLDYFGARYYSSTQGRFLSPDEFTGGPIDVFGPADPSPPGPLPYAEIANPQSLNKYAYTFNNPTRFIDPNGHGVMDFILGVGNAVTSNFANGIGRDNPSNSSQAAGQKVGDAISAVGGFIEMAAGSLAVVGGASEALITLPAAGTGAGAAIPAAGIATAAGGLVVATHGAVVLGKSISMMRAHGNTAGNQPAELYEKTDKDGNLEKHGVSQDASKRYSKTEVGEGKVTVTDRGPRKKMLAKERQKVEKNPGPENHEPWAGKKKKGQ